MVATAYSRMQEVLFKYFAEVVMRRYQDVCGISFSLGEHCSLQLMKCCPCRLIGPDMTVSNEKLNSAVEQTWTKFNAVPNLKIKMNITSPVLAEGSKGRFYCNVLNMSQHS